MDAHTMALLMFLVQFVTQVKVNGFSAWLIQALKTNQSKWTSWITVNTPWVTRFVALVTASLTAAGLTWTFSGGTLVIHGITYAAVLGALWHIAQSYLIQHAWFKSVFKN